jgi:hypothetical protein
MAGCDKRAPGRLVQGLMGESGPGAVQVLLASAMLAALGRRLGPVFGAWHAVLETGNAVGDFLLLMGAEFTSVYARTFGSHLNA